MTKGYLGIDIGSISTKGVIIDENRAIIARSYLWTEGNPTEASKNVVRELERQVEGAGVDIVGAGTTGSAGRLVGAMLGASVIKNEITAHAVGTTHLHPDVRTILEIGGQDSKIICVSDGIAVDYAMNTLCAAGTGSFPFSVRVPAPPKATSTGLQLTATESPVRTARSPATGHGNIAFPVTAKGRPSTRSAPSTSSPETGRSLTAWVPMGSPCTAFSSPGCRNTQIAAPAACVWMGVFMYPRTTPESRVVSGPSSTTVWNSISSSSTSAMRRAPNSSARLTGPKDGSSL